MAKQKPHDDGVKKYVEAVKRSWTDGILAYEEYLLLEHMRNELGISAEDNLRIMREAVFNYRMGLGSDEKKFLDEHMLRMEIYQEIVNKCWINGALSHKEFRLIDSMREFLKITPTEHVMCMLKADKVIASGHPRDVIYSRTQDELMLAKMALNFKNYGDALKHLDKVLKEDEKNAEAWYYRGVVHVRMSEYKESLKYFEQSLKYDRTADMTWYMKGISHMALGEDNEAHRCLDVVIGINPTIAAAWYNKGVLFMRHKEYKNGLGCFERAIRIVPDDIRLKKAKEMCESMMDKPE